MLAGPSWVLFGDCGIRQNIETIGHHFTGPCFLEAFVCAAWSIWKERNDHIFRGIVPSFPRWKVRFQTDLKLHRYRVKSQLVQPLIDWLASLFV
jgi:hypothetical protein